MVTTAAILENEIWSGAGASATFIPESAIYMGADGTITGAVFEPNASSFSNKWVLVPDLYKGCLVRVTYTANGITSTQYFTVKSNTVDSITFDEDAVAALGGSSTITVNAYMMPYGAPCPVDTPTNGTYALLADNWLGLVNSFTPPSLEVETQQMNLALGGTRNFTYQYKKGSTVTGVSLDVSMHHGAWLYYALGRIASINTTDDSLGAVATGYTGLAISAHNETRIYKIDNDQPHPPAPETWTNGILSGAMDTYTGLKKLDTAAGVTPLEYTFTERNDGTLPSFALEVSYEKEGIADDYRYTGSQGDSSTDATTTPYKDIFTRIVTGCQVNSFTMSFEEGQELKCSLDLVARRLFDAPIGYAPRNGKSRALSNLTNFRNADDVNVQPYFFSDGTIQIYGQTYARIKSGSLTINNNLTAQRYIGNYSKDMVSAHIGGQRLYDLSFTMQITDTTLWDNLRAEGEHLGAGNKIQLKFSKNAEYDTDGDLDLDGSDANPAIDYDYIEIQLEDFITQSLDVPFPEDKGPVEVSVTLAARTLASCKYRGMWAIINQEY